MASSGNLGGISRVWRSRNYRYFWLGNAGSLIGFWIYKLAIGWLTWELTESPFWLGMVGFAALFPAAFLSPLAGAVADRFGQRRTAMWALAATAAVPFAIAALVFSEKITPELIFVLTLAQGICIAFDLPARISLVPYLVERDNLASAIAMNSTTFHAGAFIGPALFGLINAELGLGVALAQYGVMQIAFIAALSLIDVNEERSSSRGVMSLATDIKDGVRYVFAQPGVLSIFALSAMTHLTVRPYMDLLPGFAGNVFHLDASGFAVLAAATGIGAIVGGILIALRGGIIGLTRINVFANLAAILSLFVFSILGIFWLGLATLAILGFALVTAAVTSQTLVQGRVDPKIRGRVISLSTGMAVGFPAIGAIIQGSLGSTFGIQAPVAGSMVLALIYWVWAAHRLMGNAVDLETTFSQAR